MSTVTIGISSFEDTVERARRAFKGVGQGERISFETVEDLWKVLTPRRWEIIRAMAGGGPMSIRAAARLVGHDVKTIHDDVQALLRAQILEKDGDGQIVFPYDAVHVDFVITKAA